jgi:hypothetical protein
MVGGARRRRGEGSTPQEAHKNLLAIDEPLQMVRGQAGDRRLAPGALESRRLGTGPSTWGRRRSRLEARNRKGHEVGTPPRAFAWLNRHVSLAAARFAADVDLEGVGACPACLLELAWKIRDGETPSRGLISRTADWIWGESHAGFRRAIVRARMEEVPGAEEALHDFELNAWRGPYFQAIVCRLAHELADELGAYSS